MEKKIRCGFLFEAIATNDMRKESSHWDNEDHYVHMKSRFLSTLMYRPLPKCLLSDYRIFLIIISVIFDKSHLITHVTRHPTSTATNRPSKQCG